MFVDQEHERASREERVIDEGFVINKKPRLLKANEIEVRVGKLFKDKGAAILLLYKNARVDQAVLDETYGAMNWKRTHDLVGGNNYCTVSVWCDDKREWVGKSDCGIESFSDKEKGEASDSFKRACVNWGIGRELYTAGMIWAKSVNITEFKGKTKTNDRFSVSEISYVNGIIESLTIKNQNDVIVFNKKSKITPRLTPKPTPLPTAVLKTRREIPQLTEKTVKQKIQDILIEKYGKDPTVLSNEIERLSSFTGKDSKLVKGRRNLSELSDGALRAFYGKLKKEVGIEKG